MLTLAPEWARQRAVLIAWPRPDGDFGPWLNAVEASYEQIARAIAAFQTLLIACRDADHQRHIETRLQTAGVEPGRIVFVPIPYDDIWVRDTAPLTLQSADSSRLLNFRFNGWGGKYPCEADTAFGSRLYASGVLGDSPLTELDFVLEGGSVESDGAGTLLTTRHCLLNPNRNPGMDQAAIEGLLKRELGIERILWLENGHLQGDDTDAHIDTLARFCSPDTIAYSHCDDPDHPDYPELAAMRAELESFRTGAGEPYRLVPLPLPALQHDETGHGLPGGYANFLIINSAVLVPCYDDPMDREAQQRLAPCFPDRQIIGVPCGPLIRQYGSLHCMTMQFPEPTRPETQPR